MTQENAALRLTDVRVENLRGFSDTSLHLVEPTTFLVGSNNSGKTSLLRLLDVAFNYPLGPEYTRSSDDLLSILDPARDTANRARRLTLWIAVRDSRRHRKLKCEGGFARLRLTLRKRDRSLRLNLGPPKRQEVHDRVAEDFLKEVRDNIKFELIPASRSATSNSFETSIDKAMTDILLKEFDKPGRGATRTERQVQKLINEVEKVSLPATEFWLSLSKSIPNGWVTDMRASSSVSALSLAEFMVSQLNLAVSTGDHDIDGVAATEVGSGLQSLLDLELRRKLASESDRYQILAVEEPEAFLHPAAQRRLAREYMNPGPQQSLLVSTHSPLVIEEARFEQLAILKDHQICQPAGLDSQRNSINTTLLAGRAAEMMFSQSVLLVEGPGDREYWEAIRRRLATTDQSGYVDRCFVLETGGNTQFAPWLRMLEAIHQKPISWIAMMDADSANQLLQCASDSSLSLSQRQEQLIHLVRSEWAQGSVSGVESAARSLSIQTSSEAPVMMAPVDLEYLMCSQMSSETAKSIASLLGLAASTPIGLAEKLGTKRREGLCSIDGETKQPWMRRLIGELTPPRELDLMVKMVCQKWLSPRGASDSFARAWDSFVRTAKRI